MKKFWGICNNDNYNVGCNGASVYVYDKNGKELKVFKDAPYTYRAKFKPNNNILVAKSTAGFLLIYDLDELKLLKKIKTSQIGSQDDGFVFSKDGLYLYNIERPIYSTKTRLTIYNMKDYSVIRTLFENDERYYVLMAQAWVISYLYMKFPLETYDFLKNSNLSYKIKSKAISKILDSYQIDNIEKEKVRKLRALVK